MSFKYRKLCSYLASGCVATTLFMVPAHAFVEGCSEASVTDVSVVEHVPARCNAGYPAAVPLPEKQTITVGTSTTSLEFVAVLMVGLDKGEFAKENLDVKVEIAPSPNGTQLTAQRKLDISLTAPDGAFYNAVAQGYNLKWALGNFSARPGGGAGLWAKAGTTVQDLKGEVIGTMVGPGSTVVHFISKALGASDNAVKLKDVQITRFDASSLVQLMQNDGAKAVWLLDPAWVPLKGDAAYVQLGEQPANEAFGGAIFGPTILEDNPEAGVAFSRAYIRTINTYFRDDYKSDPQFLEYLAKILKQPVDTLKLAPSAVWDWEMRESTTTDLQTAMQTGGALTYPELMPVEKLVDRSFYLRALGAE